MTVKKIIALTALIFAAALAGAVIAAFISPPLIVFVENHAGRALSYEVWLRLYLAIIMLALWWGYVFGSVRDYWSRDLLGPFTAGLAVFLAVLVLDRRWVITEEMSWIRYPTAGFLAGAGLILWRLFFLKKIETRIDKSKKPSHWRKSQNPERLAAFVLGAGLVFAAADELFTIHERIGALIERVLSVSHTATDVVTAVYGIVGLTVLILLGYWLRIWLRDSPAARMFIIWYAVGMLLFIAATAFDTADGVIFSLVRRVTDALARRDYEFSDAWFIIYKPKLFLNAVEELFEYIAAGVFLLGAWRLYSDTKSAVIAADESFHSGPSEIPTAVLSTNTIPSGGRKLVYAATGLFLTAAFLSGYRSFKLPRTGPFSDPSVPVTRIASLAEGLFHADDLDYHPGWGVVIANESDGTRVGTSERPGVFSYKDGEFKRLPDPRDALLDIDSLAATTDTIYASSGALGKILFYNKKIADWEENGVLGEEKKTAGFSKLSAGLYKKSPLPSLRPSHPEAIALHDKIMIVADESERALYVITPTGTTRETPTHPLFKSPEGIVWHDGLKQFLVTDDTTGAVFKYTPGRPLEIFADASDGLRYPEDVTVGPSGEVIVSDNGRREIVIFDDAGAVTRRLRLRGLYRDAQGVTVDAKGNLYFVTADAFESESFVPSVLWRVDSANSVKFEYL